MVVEVEAGWAGADAGAGGVASMSIASAEPVPLPVAASFANSYFSSKDSTVAGFGVTVGLTALLALRGPAPLEVERAGESGRSGLKAHDGSFRFSAHCSAENLVSTGGAGDGGGGGGT